MPKSTILIVEDDSDIRESIQSVLEPEGYKIYKASNGLEAMKVLTEIQGACLILLDLMMPEMNGFDFIEAIRNGTNTFIQIPVVAVTGSKQVDVPKGAVGLIKKPFDLDELYRVVKIHCDAGAA